MALVDERDVRPRTVAGFKNNIKKEKKYPRSEGSLACGAMEFLLMYCC